MIALPSEYGDRLVAFVDILGWSKAVREPEKLRDVIQAIFAVDGEMFISHSAVRHHPEADIHWTAFSDCIVYSCGAGSPHDIAHVLRAVSRLYVELLQLGFMCRGAVVVGKAIHKNSIVIGPALVDAVNLERTLAVFPRIVLRDHDMMHLRGVLEDREILRQADGTPFLNPLLAYFPFGEQDSGPRNRMICEVYAKWLARLDALKVPNSPAAGVEAMKVLSKHEWLIDHIRNVSALIRLPLNPSS